MRCHALWVPKPISIMWNLSSVQQLDNKNTRIRRNYPVAPVEARAPRQETGRGGGPRPDCRRERRQSTTEERSHGAAESDWASRQGKGEYPSRGVRRGMAAPRRCSCAAQAEAAVDRRAGEAACAVVVGGLDASRATRPTGFFLGLRALVGCCWAGWTAGRIWKLTELTAFG